MDYSIGTHAIMTFQRGLEVDDVVPIIKHCSAALQQLACVQKLIQQLTPTCSLVGLYKEYRLHSNAQIRTSL